MQICAFWYILRQPLRQIICTVSTLFTIMITTMTNFGGGYKIFRPRLTKYRRGCLPAWASPVALTRLSPHSDEICQVGHCSHLFYLLTSSGANLLGILGPKGRIQKACQEEGRMWVGIPSPPTEWSGTGLALPQKNDFFFRLKWRILVKLTEMTWLCNLSPIAITGNYICVHCKCNASNLILKFWNTIKSGGTICISFPHSKFWGTSPSCPPVIYADAGYKY